MGWNGGAAAPGLEPEPVGKKLNGSWPGYWNVGTLLVRLGCNGVANAPLLQFCVEEDPECCSAKGFEADVGDEDGNELDSRKGVFPALGLWWWWLGVAKGVPPAGDSVCRPNDISSVVYSSMSVSWGD